MNDNVRYPGGSPETSPIPSPVEPTETCTENATATTKASRIQACPAVPPTEEAARTDHDTRTRLEVPDETRGEIRELHAFYGTRQIARRVGLSRKIIRRVLSEEGCLVQPEPVDQSPSAGASSKLDPFRESIVSRVKTGLTTTRILREIQSEGYDGGRTILADHVRKLHVELAVDAISKQVKRRFETAPGEEMQIDWSPYQVPIGGRPTKIRALGCLLCASRKLYLRFYRDERESTLLEGLASAMEYFHGATLRVVLDNMATAVLGRIGPDREILWHPRFIGFARYYGFKPFACMPRDPNRKGKKEKSFRLVWDDFLKGSKFESWDDLDARRKLWLDETPDVGNLRVHGTTGLVPNEAWLSERELLIKLPRNRFPVHEEAARDVDRDSTLWIHGTPYTVPAQLANRAVAVRLYAEHFEVLDPHGRIAFSRRYVPDSEKGKLQIDETHYATLKRRPRGAGTGGDRLDDAFIKRFPELAPLVDGLKWRMKTLAPVHVRRLLHLLDRYGEEAFLGAARRAQEHGRYDAVAVQRILESTHPLPEGDTIAPLNGLGPIAIGELEPGSLERYGHLDADEPSAPSAGEKEDDDHGA
jgi:transposase